MTKSIIIAVGIIIGLCACSKDVKTAILNDEGLQSFEIHFGSFGGLCGYSDSLSVFSTLDLYYEQKSICTDQDLEKTDTASRDQMNAIISAVDLDQFATLNLNSCDRCVDGLDTYINIETDDYQHRIQYGAGDDISSISDLVTQLNDLRDDYKEE